MATYPSSIKTFTTKEDNVDVYAASHVNDLQGEVTAIETELGALVKGSATDLKTRLAVSLDGYGGVKQGTGFPGSPVNGQMFFRSDSNTFYVYYGGSWYSAVTLSNVLFQFTAYTDSATVTTAATYTSALGSNYLYLGTTSSSYTTMYRTKLIKISGVNTLTVYAQIWQENSSTDPGFDNRVFCQVDVNAGGITGDVTGARGVVTPTWHTLSTLNISGLSNGTAYDVLVQIKRDASNSRAYIGNVIGFGS